MDISTIAATRLLRHGLAHPPTDSTEYIDLFRMLQPVSTAVNVYPGSPPRLAHRCIADTPSLAENLRANRKIVKGRFLGGTIGYVIAEDLQLFGNVFQKPIDRMTPREQRIYDAIALAGPLTPRQIKQETGLLNKQIMPIMHKLQKAFLVYEDQIETDWERGWYGFSSEWPDIELDATTRLNDTAEVIARLISANVFLTFPQIKDWSGLPIKRIKDTITHMVEKHIISAHNVRGIGDGWCLIGDKDLSASEPAESIFVLDAADPLTRAHKSELKTRFAGLEVLQYLLIDGEFSGAACGHWRIGPYDVDDIVVNSESRSLFDRRDLIIRAVKDIYPPPNHQILRYDGRQI